MTFGLSKPSSPIVLSLLCLLVAASVQFAAAQETSADLMNRAYEFRTSNYGEAVRLLKQAIEKDPSNIDARRQLGYLYLTISDNEDALRQFEASEKIHSSDTIKLQIAYILGSLH